MDSYSATRHEIAAWALTGIALVLVLSLHLLTALLGGLLVYELVHILAEQFRFARISSASARIVAVGILSPILIALVTFAAVATVEFFRTATGGLGALMAKLSEIVESTRAYLPQSIMEEMSPDADGLKKDMANWLGAHAGKVE